MCKTNNVASFGFLLILFSAFSTLSFAVEYGDQVSIDKVTVDPEGYSGSPNLTFHSDSGGFLVFKYFDAEGNSVESGPALTSIKNCKAIAMAAFLKDLQFKYNRHDGRNSGWNIIDTAKGCAVGSTSSDSSSGNNPP